MLNQKSLPWNCGLGEFFLELLLLSQLRCCDVIAVCSKLLARNERCAEQSCFCVIKFVMLG
jgi:hypothetical protein